MGSDGAILRPTGYGLQLVHGIARARLAGGSRRLREIHAAEEGLESRIVAERVEVVHDGDLRWDYYNTGYWKQSVTCQELGHDISLDHQDENFSNVPLLSCMDYQNPPFPWANPHDFEQLAAIYDHVDAYDSYAGDGGGGGGGGKSPPGKGYNKSGFGNGNSAAEWGMSLGRHGTQETFIRRGPDGTRHITFDTWVERH